MTLLRRYTFKIYPNKAQTSALDRQCVLLARLWNAAIEERQGCFQKTGKSLSFYDQGASVKTIRADDPEYAAMSFDTLSSVLDNLDKAYKAFFSRMKKGVKFSEAGFPKFRSSALWDTIPFRSNGNGWKITASGSSWRLYIKGIGVMRARGKFPVSPDKIKTSTVMKRDGAWWISIVAEMPVRRAAGTESVSVAFDEICGLTANGGYASADFSNRESGNHSTKSEVCFTSGADRSDLGGERRCLHKRAKFGRGADRSELIDALKSYRDTRLKRFSRRWKKCGKRIATIQAKQARKHNYDLHKWTSDLVKVAAEISVTHPKISDVTKTGRGDSRQWGAAVKTVAMLNRHILNMAPSSAIQMISYKAEESSIPLTVTEIAHHSAFIGQDIKHAKVAARTARKTLKAA